MRSLPVLAALAVLAHASAQMPVPREPAPPKVQQQQETPLQARIIEVKGRAQWRPSDEAAWKKAKVDDVLEAGAEVRTGLRSSIALRVGKNATVLVDRATRLSLSVLVQQGQTLRTRAAVRRGRADFKVNLIGLTNDFEVLTPSTTLAVRGTGFAVTWGALEGVRVDALSAEVAAVELRYLLKELRYLLTAGTTSLEGHPDPVVAALFETFEAPPAALTEAEVLNQLADDSFLRDPESLESLRILNGLGGVQRVEEFLEMFQEPPPPPGPELDHRRPPTGPTAPPIPAMAPDPALRPAVVPGGGT